MNEKLNLQWGLLQNTLEGRLCYECNNNEWTK